MKDITVSEAVEVIKKAMVEDIPGKPGSLAHAWHCNIAMMCYDAIFAHDENFGVGNAHKIGNDAASRFMNNCFDVETKG